MAIDKNDDYIEWAFTYDFSYLDPPLQETIGKHIEHSRSFQKSWINEGSKKATLSGPESITLHWTATYNIENAINVLRSRKVGYNFLIDINGTIVQTLSVNRRANHAGTSWGPRGNTWTSDGCLNDYSIGISFVFTPEKQYEKYFIHDAGEIQKINSKQLKSAAELIACLKTSYPSIKWVTSHFEIVPWNKGDVWYFALPGKEGGSCLGHKYIEQIKADYSLTDLKWWSCGSDWYEDKPFTQQQLSNMPTLVPNGTYRWKTGKYRNVDCILRHDKKVKNWRPYSKGFAAPQQANNWGNGWKGGRDTNLGANDINMDFIDNEPSE